MGDRRRVLDVDAWQRVSLSWASTPGARPCRYMATARQDGSVLLVPVDEITGEPVVSGLIEFAVPDGPVK